MKYQLKVYSIWEFGQRKDSAGNPHQEDSLFPEFGKQSDSDRLFILCDGMGGHEAGEVASATVCEAMSQSVLNDGHDKEGVFTLDDFNTALDRAFTALDGKDSGAEKKMGTTMTFLKLHNGGAFIAHMGDSRVYHIRPGKDGNETRILFETSDHSLVNDLIKIGELTREEARHSKQKNVITRAMQPNPERRPKADVYQTADIRPGDYFYMCSDGMLEQPEMEDGTSLRNIFSDMGGDDRNKVEILKSVTEKNRDNHTAFIIHITDVTDAMEKSPASASDGKADKFVAIVDEDSSVAESPSAETPATETPASTESPVAADKSSVAAVRGVPQESAGNRDKSRARSKVIRFATAAIAVAAIVVGIGCIKSYFPVSGGQQENAGSGGEVIRDTTNGKKHQDRKKIETSAVTNEEPSVQSADTPPKDSLTSEGNNSQQAASAQANQEASAHPQTQAHPQAPANQGTNVLSVPQPSVNSLPRPGQDNDVVDSDTQRLQNGKVHVRDKKKRVQDTKKR